MGGTDSSEKDAYFESAKDDLIGVDALGTCVSGRSNRTETRLH